MASIAFNTALGAVLLATLTRPEATNEILIRLTDSRVSLSSFRAVTGALFGLGSLLLTNSYLSRRAYNNWTTDKTWDWTREIVVVTGGSSGLGKILVQKLSARGVKVVSIDINEPSDAETLPSNVYFYKADLSSREDIRTIADKIKEDIGNPTVLINNAGLVSWNTILKQADDEANRVFAVNTISHYHLVRAFLPYMVERNHGHVVTIASAASYAALANTTVYAASKAAALAFHEGLAQELKWRYGAPAVRTTIVHPTYMRTPMTAKLMAVPTFKAMVVEPEDVADAVLAKVLKGEAGQLIFAPDGGLVVGFIRGMPWWIQEAIRDGESKGSKLGYGRLEAS